ncbi:ATP-binding protein [Mycolicibacterium wolinskyi]|uniref:ATP-binding protein n=1 Tax=Mycolicibacterium wolinskyi TaxID=59750 RepID=UPI000B0F4CC4|nr:ATP-binding protein [Mycolicibacterium wolinskyi]
MTSDLSSDPVATAINEVLLAAGVDNAEIKIREFPDEYFAVVTINQDEVATVETLTGQIQQVVARSVGAPDSAVTVLVRVNQSSREIQEREKSPRSGRLANPRVDQLIRLLEARSRTSITVPSLQYKEDPRASVDSAAEARNHLIFGRRGVGKTALLLEVRRAIEDRGDCEHWVNAQVYRHLDPDEAYVSIICDVLAAIVARLSDRSPIAASIESARESLKSATDPGKLIPSVNSLLRSVLVPDVLAMYLFIDDFYLYPLKLQATFLDKFASSFRDCNAWIKLASIERLTRVFEPSTRLGLEVPHDATVIDLDVTLEQPDATQKFLESVVQSYITSVGISSPRSIAKPEALGRLVLSSGGVPRDYLNLFANSIVGARKARQQAAEIGREDVSKAAGEYSQSKKRDLEQDVGADESQRILSVLDNLNMQVKGNHFTYFRVDWSQKTTANYELLGRLVDLRFCHLIQAAISDQHRAGIKYEAYLLALSEYSDVRVQRNLSVLDIVNGTWVAKTTGRARSSQQLTATQLRDKLRVSPIVDLGSI